MLKKYKLAWAFIISVCLLISAFPMTALAAKPRLIMEQVSFSDKKISKGERFNVSFELRNYSMDEIKNVYINIPSSDFSVIHKGSNFKVTDSIHFNGSAAVSLELECHEISSNKIPVIIHYEDIAGIPQVLEEQLLVTFEDEQKTPKFLISSTEVPMIGVGETRDLSITLENISDQEAGKVVIRPVISPELLSKISFNQVNMEPADITIPSGQQQRFEYSVTVNGTQAPGIYPISYEIQCENSKKETFTSMLNGYLKVTSDSIYNDFYVTTIATSPKELARDQEMKLTIGIKNSFEQEYKDLNVWIEGLPTQSFVYQEDKWKKIPSVKDKKKLEVTFNYYITDQAIEGYYPYEIHIAYTDSLGNRILNKESYGLYLSPVSEDKGILTVQKVKLPDAPVAAEQEFNVSLEVCNTGVKELEDIAVAFTGTEILSKSNSTVTVNKLAPGERRKVNYTLIAGKQPEEKNLPISFVITYDMKKGEGAEVKTLNQSFGITVEGAAETSQPKIILSELLLPEQIYLGEEFELQFSLTNTHADKSIRNMKVTMNSKDATTQASNIILIGQSDSIFVPALPCNEKTAAKVSLLIPDSYKNSVCDINFNFSYEDESGTIYTDVETIHLPVAEETTLTASNVRIGNVRDDGYTLELDFYNTGKGILKNLMVDLVGEFESTNSNYYVGDLQSGRMDIYSVAVNGEIPEDFTGTVLFTYEDNAGRKNELEVPFELHYTKPVVEPVITEENTKKGGFPYFAVVLLGLGGIVTFIVFRRKRKAI